MAVWQSTVTETATAALHRPLAHACSLYKWMDSFSDPRSREWFLMQSPLPTLTLVAVYLYLVRNGPLWMASRRPFRLRWPLVIYNAYITYLNGWMAYEVRIGVSHGGRSNFLFVSSFTVPSRGTTTLRVNWWTARAATCTSCASPKPFGGTT